MTGFNTQLSAECISLLNLVMNKRSSVNRAFVGKSPEFSSLGSGLIVA